MVYKRKFKGKTHKEVSAEMSRVALARVRRLSPQERKRAARRMVDARGQWVNGIYVWKKRK